MCDSQGTKIHCRYIQMHTHMCVYTYKCTLISVYIYIYIFIYIYIYSHTATVLVVTFKNSLSSVREFLKRRPC